MNVYRTIGPTLVIFLLTTFGPVSDEETLDELMGPGKMEQWTHWKYRTEEHNNRIATKNELERILKSHDVSCSTTSTFKYLCN